MIRPILPRQCITNGHLSSLVRVHDTYGTTPATHPSQTIGATS